MAEINHSYLVAAHVEIGYIKVCNETKTRAWN